MRFNRLSIKTQLMFTCLPVVAIIIFTIFITYFRNVEIITNNNSQYVSKVMYQLNHELTKECELMENILKKLSLNSLLQDYLTVENPLHKFDLGKRIENLIEGEMSITDIVKNIAILPNQGHGLDMLGESEKLRNIYSEFNTGKDIYYSGILSGSLPGSGTNNLLLAINVYSSKSDYMYGEVIGRIILVCDAKKFGESILHMPDSMGAGFYLVDRSEKIYSSNKANAIGKNINGLVNGLDLQKENFRSRLNDTDYLVYTQKYPKLDGMIIYTVPEKELLKSIKDVRKFHLLILLAAAIILSLPMGIVIRNIINPIKKVSLFMNTVKNGNLKVLKNKVDLSAGPTEITTMLEDFNGMLDEINALTHRLVETNSMLYEFELEKKQAELAFLQSQINPHFLYNTLESIKGISQYRNVPEICEMAQCLGDIFRYSIKGKDFVTLGEEISILKSYVRINEIRFSNRFETEYKLDHDALQGVVPKMILQPIVENAIYHGLEMKDGIGCLSIKSYVNINNELIVSIEDNGMGIDESKLSGLQKQLSEDISSLSHNAANISIGLRNVNNRIKLRYGSQFGLTISSKRFEKTTVCIRLPFEKA